VRQPHVKATARLTSRPAPLGDSEPREATVGSPAVSTGVGDHGEDCDVALGPRTSAERVAARRPLILLNPSKGWPLGAPDRLPFRLFHAEVTGRPTSVRPNPLSRCSFERTAAVRANSFAHFLGFSVPCPDQERGRDLQRLLRRDLRQHADSLVRANRLRRRHPATVQTEDQCGGTKKAAGLRGP